MYKWHSLLHGLEDCLIRHNNSISSYAKAIGVVLLYHLIDCSALLSSGLDRLKAPGMEYERATIARELPLPFSCLCSWPFDRCEDDEPWRPRMVLGSRLRLRLCEAHRARRSRPIWLSDNATATRQRRLIRYCAVPVQHTSIMVPPWCLADTLQSRHAVDENDRRKWRKNEDKPLRRH